MHIFGGVRTPPTPPGIDAPDLKSKPGSKKLENLFRSENIYTVIVRNKINHCYAITIIVLIIIGENASQVRISSLNP